MTTLTKFVLSVVGTQGDILPILALARELLDRGHDATVLSNEWGQSQAERLGVPFEVIALPYETNLGSLQENFERYVFPSYVPTFQYFARLQEQGCKTVVVNCSECSGG